MNEALATIRQYAVARRLAYTEHAIERMLQRRVSRADVRTAPRERE